MNTGRSKRRLDQQNLIHTSSYSVETTSFCRGDAIDPDCPYCNGPETD